jgi:hypothetical protein
VPGSAIGLQGHRGNADMIYMKRHALLGMILAAGLAGSACFAFSSSKTTSPTSLSAQSLGGTWSSIQSLPGLSGSLQDSCTNFQWAVTEFSGTTAAGTFSATCQGNMQISGSAQGSLSGTTINWSAVATATVQGMPPCAISLSGTAVLETDQIRIPYTGMTCLGPVSGTEIVKRK